jgi:ABC-type uncharacterized transport system substrate-binding protein
VDVGSAARSLIGKVDVIYTNTDNNVVSAYESLVKVGQDAKIPLVASDTDSVKRGAVAAYGINYRDLGEQTGRMVVRILKGEKPGDIKPEVSTKMELFVNPGAAEKQGVKLSTRWSSPPLRWSSKPFRALPSPECCLPLPGSQGRRQAHLALPFFPRVAPAPAPPCPCSHCSAPSKSA